MKENNMPDPVVHFEIIGLDAPALQKFYGQLFGWKIDANNPLKYGTVEAAEGGIGGGVAPTFDGSARVTVYVQVDDLQAALDQAEELGGKAVMPPSDIPGGPTIAQFTDPDGNQIGLMKRA
jgi:predicted enzyme related to lactoylglutathione lyase